MLNGRDTYTSTGEYTMKNYKILSATNVDTLADYIEKALNDGWNLSGDVFNTQNGGKVNQSIIKITRATYPKDVGSSRESKKFVGPDDDQTRRLTSVARSEAMGGPLPHLESSKLPPFS